MRRLMSVLLILLLSLSACDNLQDSDSYTTEETLELLRDSIDAMRGLDSFRMDVVQGGTPYRFYFQLGPAALQFVTVMTKTEGAFIAPDNLYASARILVRGVNLNVGLFANRVGQWIKPLSTGNWLEYIYAPGFDPSAMMLEGRGFHNAIRNLENVEFIGTEEREGKEVLHVRGIADGQTVNDMLFGLLVILEDLAIVDVYMDINSLIPYEITLTLPDTSTAETENTFWQIQLYSLNETISLDLPAGVVIAAPETASPVQETNYLLWGMVISGFLGAFVTPIVYYNKGYSRLLGFGLGLVLGAIGSLILLLPLWIFTPTKGKLKTSELGDTALPASHTYQRMGKVNPWIVIAFISIPVFVGSLDLTVVSAFMPKLLIELGLPLDTGLDDASWVVTVYLLAYTVSLTFTGRLSDLLGRRMVYMLCLLTFIVGSVWVALANGILSDTLFSFYRSIDLRTDRSYVSLQVIILGRIVQAIGAGALVPVSLALVGDMFPPERRARPLGLVAAMDTLGWVLGPVYGGIFLQFLPWQGLFWINVPLTFIALFSVLYALRNVPMQKVKGRFDYLGTLLIGGSLTALTLALGSNADLSGGNSSLQDISPLPPYAIPMMILAGMLFISFLFVERHLPDPLVSLKMFKRRNLSMASLVNLLVGYCLFIGLVSVPLLVNLRLDSGEQITQAALQTGILLSSLTLPMAFAAVPGGWLSDRIGVKYTIILGLLFSLVGYLAMWQTWTIEISDIVLALEMVVIGTGIGLTFSPISTAIINSAYDHERGVASALVIILRLVGMTISISTLSSIMYYRAIVLAGSEASAGGTIGIEQIIASLNAVVQVLGEMGLIGAILSALAIVPALFIDQHVNPPDSAV